MLSIFLNLLMFQEAEIDDDGTENNDLRTYLLHNLAEENAEFNPHEKLPLNFEDLIQSENFLRPIDVKCDKSVGEIMTMVFEYGYENECTATALSNLFKFVNTLFPQPVLPNSKYSIVKLFNPQNRVEYHAVCDNCGAYVGKLGEINHIQTCMFCNFNLNVKNPCEKNFFVLIDPTKQISDLLKMCEDYYDYVIKDRIGERGYIKDVYDGNEYKKFVRSLPEDRKDCYVTSVFNTDGTQKFKRSKSSVWPLLLMLNELPVQERLDKLVSCGLWFSSKKPDMGSLLTVLSISLIAIKKKGFLVKLRTKVALYIRI